MNPTVDSYINAVYLRNNFYDRYRVRIQAETKTLTLNGVSNDEIGGTSVGLPFIKIHGSRRVHRSYTRRVQIKRVIAGATLADRVVLLWVVWLTPTGFDQFSAGMTGTYQGTAVEIVKTQGERIV